MRWCTDGVYRIIPSIFNDWWANVEETFNYSVNDDGGGKSFFLISQYKENCMVLWACPITSYNQRKRYKISWRKDVRFKSAKEGVGQTWRLNYHSSTTIFGFFLKGKSFYKPSKVLSNRNCRYTLSCCILRPIAT